MFKKTYYGAHIAPACAYCLHGSTAADPKMILCKRKGVVSPYYCCRKFSYDPLMRIPRRQAVADQMQFIIFHVIISLSITLLLKATPHNSRLTA